MTDSIINRTAEVNKLQGEYLSSNLNEVWTIDITSIKQKYYFFFILDLASRRIVYYDVSQHDYTGTEATLVLVKALKKESEVQPSRPVSFVHTDSGRIFLSKEWLECLKVNNILPSSADSKRNQNQVSERFNRTFKKLLRDKLNIILNKKNNKTNTFQLIGEATKYNFENLKKLTEEIIVYYNSEKPHFHLNELPPDTWANQARQLPEQKYTFEEKGNLLSSELNSEVEVKGVLDMPKKVLIDHIETIKNYSEELNGYENLKEKDSSEILNNMLDLQTKKIVPFTPLSKNDNSEQARKIREYKNNIANLELIQSVKDSKIDISKMDVLTQEMYEKISKETASWQETDVKYLETIMLQNHILLANMEELKAQTHKLELQNKELLENNKELLDMNHYLVETTERIEEEKKIALERKLKRQKAKKLEKRDYISSNEFYEIVLNLIYKCEDSLYIIARNRIAFFIMYFTGLRVSNLLVLNVRNIKDLMHDKIGTEIRIIKGGRSNQLISLGEDAQKLLINDFYDDVAMILKNKDDDHPVFTSDKNHLVPLHRVTLTESLNRTLKYASEEFHKRITCHSFRATFITEGIINNIPIHGLSRTS